ncbi:replication-associated recombination protein A [Psychroflexus sp. ALD_RP9]|uniref:replication-associated recombination protein A n=1 Tax=Psychroflexus sp. ALD_RP9 TaxID=2777186 RepID=UPI001A8FC168|nr:replication-associated recombination protein A [Psychroflexus sp. ALD_RP9]QSS97761.1 replication-associated recombination protein A [Psychroflexus sp. ALD_RP9]
MNNTPLAERLRPKKLEDFLNQEHLVGINGSVKKLLDNKVLPSLIFWGPPGVGKTTLANIIAETTQRQFFTLSAINSGVKDVREVIDKAKQNAGLFTSSQNPILFIDEIHRFSKSQQDSLLLAVEKGWITLIGATTENPSFEVNAALLSRCQVYTLNAFNQENLKQLLDKAIKTDKVLNTKDIYIKEYEALIGLSGFDARKLLNNFEIVVSALDSNHTIEITNNKVNNVLQQTSSRYDKNGEQHYDVISAFIKSIRGSDVNASVYWLARLLDGGEDVKFIARRLIILASEDIGLANPTALVMANNTFQAVNSVGMPEGRIILSQCVIYLASSPKSNSCYVAINNAMKAVKEYLNAEVPLSLRNAPTKLMKDLGYSNNYKYAHDYKNNFVQHEFMPESLKGKGFYKAGNNSKELQLKQKLKQQWGNKYEF